MLHTDLKLPTLLPLCGATIFMIKLTCRTCFDTHLFVGIEPIAVLKRMICCRIVRTAISKQEIRTVCISKNIVCWVHGISFSSEGKGQHVAIITATDWFNIGYCIFTGGGIIGRCLSENVSN